MPDKNIDGTMFLVNRQHTVAEQYIPDGLRKTEVYGMSQSMREDAATALEAFFEAAKTEGGVSLSTVSGYRSYSKQSTIYARKKSTTGSTEAADKLVAKPGTSEHQLGLAMDIARKGSSSLTAKFGETEEGKWVYSNCHRYGFIVRYMQGFEEITGYSYEPWHIRYVGVEQATAIYESGVPMETYMSGLKLDTYDYLVHQATNEVLP
ncbi:MAG: M15 family metallopeptidase [Eubacteriales bacterium]|nr:M15 family metallopeptidase [Eubacteriales bacterium]